MPRAEAAWGAFSGVASPEDMRQVLLEPLSDPDATREAVALELGWPSEEVTRGDIQVAIYATGTLESRSLVYMELQRFSGLEGAASASASSASSSASASASGV